jgi:hypothetical protein
MAWHTSFGPHPFASFTALRITGGYNRDMAGLSSLPFRRFLNILSAPVDSAVFIYCGCTYLAAVLIYTADVTCSYGAYES